jgi:hypothetical protein
VVVGLHYSRKSDRGASLSGRGQWACALRRPSNWSGEAKNEEDTRAHAKPLEVSVAILLFPLAPMLAPRFSMCRAFPSVYEWSGLAATLAKLFPGGNGGLDGAHVAVASVSGATDAAHDDVIDDQRCAAGDQ